MNRVKIGSGVIQFDHLFAIRSASSLVDFCKCYIGKGISIGACFILCIAMLLVCLCMHLYSDVLPSYLCRIEETKKLFKLQ